MFSTQFFLGLCGVFVLGLPNMGHTSKIDVSFSGQGLVITCRPGDKIDTGDQEILRMNIYKDGHLYVHINENAGSLVFEASSFGPAPKWASGGIFNTRVGFSNLALVMKDPKPEDGGVYECEVYYKDAEGQLKVSKSETTLDLGDPLTKTAFPATSTTTKAPSTTSTTTVTVPSTSKATSTTTVPSTSKATSTTTVPSTSKATSTTTVTVPSTTPKAPETTTEDFLKTLQDQINEIKAQLKTHKTVYDTAVNNAQKLDSDLGVNLKELRKETNRQFDHVVQMHYVSKDDLDKTLKHLKNSLEEKIDDNAIAMNLKLYATKGALENSLKSHENMGTGLKDGIERMEQLQNSFVKKADLSPLKDRLDAIEDVLESQSERISLLSDKVSVNEYVVQLLSNVPKPTTTKAPATDPVVEVLEKVEAMEKRSHNQTRMIDYLLERELETFYEINSIANITILLDQILNGTDQKNQDDNNDVNVAFCAHFEDKQKVFARQLVVFDNVTLNQGQCYNDTSSAFTAPVTGVYVFHLTLMTSTKDDFIDAEIRNNRDVLVRLTSPEIEHDDQTTVSVVAKLQARDAVRVFVTMTDPLGSDLLGHKASVFSGYLMK